MVILLFTGNNYTHMYITLLGLFFFFFSNLHRPPYPPFSHPCEDRQLKSTPCVPHRKNIYMKTTGLNKGLRPMTTISYGCTLVTQFTQEASISYAMK